MFETRSIYKPLVKLCKELINEKKALIEENECLKEKLESTKHNLSHARAQNRFLSESLAYLQNEKRKDLEKRVADLEEQLAKKVCLVDDEGTPIKSFTLTGKLTMLDKTTEEKLEVGKWYDARTFEVEELKELLPVGTKVAIITDSQRDEEETINKKVPTYITKVTKVVKEYDVMKGKKQTAVYADIYQFVPNNWFKIIKE